ncbi:hypothetical protein B0O80DRAFT_500059 [Mortierella sp. GBAus27b]|nr:hypothetical protein B0O80DRAFT_500059 [Mortierella sp. GBAus27b]
MTTVFCARHYFSYEKPPGAKAAVNVWGKPRKKDHLSTDHAPPVIIPQKTSAFKFGATFKSILAKHYVLRWRIKVLEDFKVNGLRFSVNITYDAEPDTTGSMDCIMALDELEKLKRGHSYDLKLQDLVTVQPHLEGSAKIEVTMSNYESMNASYAGLQVEYVELKQHSGYHNKQAADNVITENVIEHCVKGNAPPIFTINYMASPVFKNVDPSEVPADLPITRIAWSKDSTYLAILALSEKTAFVTVWNMDHINDLNTQTLDMDVFAQKSTVATIMYVGTGSLQDLSIGLAISPNGDQVALYQEPKIGEWADGTTLRPSTFGFCLLHVVFKPPHQAVAVSDTSNNSRRGPNLEEKYQRHLYQMDRQIEPPSPRLDRFIGYGAFLTERKNTDWEVSDSSTTQPAKDVNHGNSSNEKNHGTMFVSCNGIYIEVFKVKPKQWESIHTIRLTDLNPTLSRRITCKMMMDTITSNTFMWLEGNGVCCTIWHLLKGSNISYISSTGNARFRGRHFRGNNKMAISPDESIVALASDGTLITYYTHTGIAIHERKFSGHKIEYVGFHGQDDQLFVILRHNLTLKPISLILDPLYLDSESKANQVPIPIIGKTALAFDEKRFGDKGVIFDTDCSNIHCYTTHIPATQIPNPTGTEFKNELTFGKTTYKVQTAIHHQSLRGGDGSMYWVLRVEVLEVKGHHKDVVFSFVPEPWMRVSTTAVRDASNLQSVYFLPDGEGRFVVLGMQTLQVWTLPSEDKPHFGLAFIWSRPRSDHEKELFRGKAFESTPVGYYYHGIRNAHIKRTPNGDFAASIKLLGSTSEDDIQIPGKQRSDTPYTFLKCAQSIHLVADAYTYSLRMSEKYPKNSRKATFTYEEHYKALTRFARSHINRRLSSKRFFPPDLVKATHGPTQPRSQETQAPYSILTTSNPSVATPAFKITSSENFQATNESVLSVAGSISSSKPKDPILKRVLTPGDDNRTKAKMCKTTFARKILPEHLIAWLDRLLEQIWIPKNADTWSTEFVTLLTLLLDQHELKEANHNFVGGLLNTENGEWVPHSAKALNPIKRAIKFRNEQLLETLIDYCVKNAKKYHPAYLSPVAQCLNELSKRHPDILSDLFRKASYVPAHNSEYVASHAIIANMRFSDWTTFFAHYFSFSFFKGRLLEWTKCRNINHFQKPVFSLRSQLPFRTTDIWNFCSIESPMHWRRKIEFPQSQGQQAPKDTPEFTEVYSHQIYVAPFPEMSSFGQYQNWSKKYLTNRVKSGFTRLSGGAFFDSPVMQATLEYKWHKYGLVHWAMPFLISLMFFVCMMATTALQIKVSSPLEENKAPSTDQIIARYLLDWRWLFILTIVLGSILILIDIRRVVISYKTVKSPYIVMRAVAYILSVVGCSIFIGAVPGTINPESKTQTDTGPRQIWFMSYAILALYLNMLFELRVFRGFGVPVYIIMKIMWRVRWFFMILAVFVISFTHALLHLLHTRSYKECTPEVDCGKDDWDGYPLDFWKALGVTTFFLAGRFEPVEKSLDEGSASFHIMMIIFFAFTALLITNILIAWMGHAFTQCKEEGKEAWHRQWSDVIADVELSFISNSSRYNRNMFPDYIYYGASEKLAAQYESTYCSIASRSNLSLENQYVLDNLDGKHDQTHSAQHDIKQKLQGINESQTQENKEVKRLQEELAQANQNIMLIMQMLQNNHLQITQRQDTMDSQYSERQDLQPGGSLHQDPRAEVQQLSDSRPNSQTSDHTSEGGFVSGSMSSIVHSRSASRGQVKYIKS